MKILYIAPHLSTGGMPQYLLTKIKAAIALGFDVYCIEYAFTSYLHNVQRIRIKSILGDKFFGLENNKLKLFTLIETIQPHIVHLEEMPEFFIPKDISDRLYDPKRSYLIYETSHDSSFDVSRKCYLPDKFVLISQYQAANFKSLGVPIEILEFPIDRKARPDRTAVLLSLGLNPNEIHVLNVGLFTERKNQKELFEVARRFDDKVKFHFVGNLAPNFESYWKPLMDNKPSNCIIWNERDDVYKFYGAMDLFYFASRGTENDKETSPLVLRESLSYGLPILMYDLPVYQKRYVGTKDVYFLKDVDYNANLLQVLIDQTKAKTIVKNCAPPLLTNVHFKKQENQIHYIYTGKPQKLFFVIKDILSNLTLYWTELDFTTGTSYWTNPIQNTAFGFLDDFKGFQLILLDQNKNILYNEPLILNEEARLSYNFQFAEPFFDFSWYNYAEFFYKNKYPKIEQWDTVVDIGANIGTFTAYALHNGAKKVFSFEPESSAFAALQKNFAQKPEVTVTNVAIDAAKGSKVLFCNMDNSTVCSFLKDQVTDFDFKRVKELEVKTISFNDIVSDFEIDHIDVLKIDTEGAEYDIFSTINWDYLNSKVETIILEFHHQLKNKDKFQAILDNLKDTFCFELLHNFKMGEPADLATDEMGIVIARRKPKIKVVHLLSNLEEDREKKSIDSIKQLQSFGFDYVQKVNPKFDGEIDVGRCARPNDVSDAPGGNNLSKGHYGCYLAHRGGFLDESKDCDAVLIFECDAIITKPIEKFVDEVYRQYFVCEMESIPLFTFGPLYTSTQTEDKSTYWINDNIFEAHAYLITKKNFNRLREAYETKPWDVADLFLTYNLGKFGIGCSKECYVLQAAGQSLIDNQNSTHNYLGTPKIS